MNVQAQPKTLSERADEVEEHKMEEELEASSPSRVLFHLADGK